MWYKNIARRFFGLVTSTRVTDGLTDRITTPKTALAQLRRAVKMMRTLIGGRNTALGCSSSSSSSRMMALVENTDIAYIACYSDH